MGGFPSYVPKSILDKFGNDPAMQDHLEIYHGLRKHGGEGPDPELTNLFSTIQFQQACIRKLEAELAIKDSRASQFESTIAATVEARDLARTELAKCKALLTSRLGEVRDE